MNVAMMSPWNRSAFSLLAHLNASFGVEFELLPLRPRMNIVHPKRLVRLPARRTQGTLTIAINPGGKALYPGQASLDAVRNKTVPLTFVNSAFLQSIDPDLGFLNLPFTITDALMAKPGLAEGVLGLVRSYVEPRGLKVLALM